MMPGGLRISESDSDGRMHHGSAGWKGWTQGAHRTRGAVGAARDALRRASAQSSEYNYMYDRRSTRSGLRRRAGSA